MVTRLLAVAAVSLLAACATGGDFCDIAKPNRISPETIDRMTEAEIDQALASNLKGQRLCGWKP